MTDQQQDPKPQAAPFPEAGGIAFTTLYGKNTSGEVMEISLTCRASTPKAALEGLWEAIGFSKELVAGNEGHPVLPHQLRPFDPRKGKLILKADGQPEQQPAPATSPAPTQTAPPVQAGSASVAPPPAVKIPPSTATTAAVPAGEQGVFVCNRLALTPQANKEAIKTDFYSSSQPNKYPAITWYARPDQIFAALAAAHQGKLEWTPEHFGYAIADYTSLPDFRVHWKRGKATGKTNSQGEATYYKDVVSITA